MLEETVRHEARGAVDRAKTGRRRPPAPRPDPSGPRTGTADRRSNDVGRVVGPDRAAKVEGRLKEAAKAFERGRFPDARRILRPLVNDAPGIATAHELLGLTHYRMGQWNAAIKELEAFRSLTGSTDQHPVLADCYRALGRHAKVAELWEELRAASPSAALVAEGRIVAAGSLADQGRLDDAIRLLSAAKTPAKRPKDHHLRVTYALADLYERAGDIPRARQLFDQVAAHDPGMGDVTARVRALR